MQALVFNFKVISVGGIYSIEHTPNNISVLFDENMCIDDSSGFFLKNFQTIMNNHTRDSITQNTLAIISNEITDLLKKVESMGNLFRGEIFEQMRFRVGMITLSNEGYEFAIKYKREKDE